MLNTTKTKRTSIDRRIQEFFAYRLRLHSTNHFFFLSQLVKCQNGENIKAYILPGALDMLCVERNLHTVYCCGGE